MLDASVMRSRGEAGQSDRTSPSYSTPHRIPRGALRIFALYSIELPHAGVSAFRKTVLNPFARAEMVPH